MQIDVCSFCFREARITLIKIHTKDNELNLSESEWNALIDNTEGYSGSDIANMTLGALFGPIRDLQAATYWLKTTGLSEGLLSILPPFILDKYIRSLLYLKYVFAVLINHSLIPINSVGVIRNEHMC